LVVLVLGASHAAQAEPLELQVGVDSFAANRHDSTALAWAEVGVWSKGEASSEGRAHALRWDWVTRESLVSDVHRRELHELAYTADALPRGFSLTAGRFRIPGGFWLFADGLHVAYQAGPVTAAVSGGLRSFTNGRTEANLRADPLALPLVAAHLSVTRPTWSGTVTFAHTRDVIELHRGFDPDGGGFDLDGETEGSDVVARTEHGDQFVDAQASWSPADDLYLGLGATVGTRYLTHYPTDPTDLSIDVRVEEQPFASASAYAVADWRITTALRLTATTGAHRTKLFAPVDDDSVLAPFDGSFLDEGLQLRWRPRPGLQLGSRYRLRLRDGGDTHRGELAARVAVLSQVELFGSAAVDWHRTTDPQPVGFAPRRSLITRGGVATERDWYSAQLGILYTEALTADAALSTPAPGASDGVLPPFGLDNRRALFLRAFGVGRGLFVGLDAELALDFAQYRGLLQMGWTR
jgi:hypothetical protein